MSSSPSPSEIVDLANKLGYKESRPQVSSTIFLVQTHVPLGGETPVKIHIYYTTRSIMTLLDHPRQGVNRLWRSHAYDDLEELEEILLDPRTHTSKGYRKATNAMRVCTKCNKLKSRTDFSTNQWKTKGPDLNQCKDCVAGHRATTNDDDTDTQLAGLTDELLHIHNEQTAKENRKNKKKTTIHDRTERRQFNCPDCPKHGRGPFLFFKRVPVLKPIVKCPQCKKASRGRCRRLYPVKTAKGYGLFQCPTCRDKWGSSRAVQNVAQECFTCLQQGKGSSSTMVKPFRIEVLKKRKSKKMAPRRPRRVPVEPIGEDAVDQPSYSENDRVRNVTGASNALVPSNHQTRSYEYQQQQDDNNNDGDSSGIVSSDGSWEVVPGISPPSRIPQGYQHKCSACKTGECRNRRVELSQVHDVSDGNTVSTSASAVTNSSIDKTDYVDRDEDFSGFDDKWTPEE